MATVPIFVLPSRSRGSQKGAASSGIVLPNMVTASHVQLLQRKKIHHLVPHHTQSVESHVGCGTQWLLSCGSFCPKGASRPGGPPRRAWERRSVMLWEQLVAAAAAQGSWACVKAPAGRPSMLDTLSCGCR